LKRSRNFVARDLVVFDLGRREILDLGWVQLAVVENGKVVREASKDSVGSNAESTIVILLEVFNDRREVAFNVTKRRSGCNSWYSLYRRAESLCRRIKTLINCNAWRELTNGNANKRKAAKFLRYIF
jgi:hypothetical protein